MLLSLIRGLLGGQGGSPRTRPEAPPQPQTAGPVAEPRIAVPPVAEPRLVVPPVERAVEAKGGEPVVLCFRTAVRDHRQETTASPETADPLLRPSIPRSRRPQTLSAAGIGSSGQRRALRSIHIRTTDDLLEADPAELVQQLQWPPAGERAVRRWQRAIRTAQTISSMTPLDALMLRAIHRRTLRALASEDAPRLYRDLKRYALSSAGARRLGNRPLPSLEQVRKWIEGARARLQCRR